MSSQADGQRLLSGVTSCFLITRGLHANETSCGINIIDAARAQPEGQFKHFVHSSVPHPILRKLVNHDSKRSMQEYLVESTVPYTTVRPTTMMEKLRIGQPKTEKEPARLALWNPEVKFAFVSCLDIGAACASILAQREKHFDATSQLIGTPQPLSYLQAMRIVSDQHGREVKIEQQSVEDGVKMSSKLITCGEPQGAAFNTTRGSARVFMYYDEEGLLGNANVLEMWLGRRLLSYEEGVKSQVCGAQS